MARATGSIGMGSVNVSGLGTLTDPLQRGLALQQQAEGQREDRYQKSLLGTADMIAKQQQMEMAKQQNARAEEALKIQQAQEGRAVIKDARDIAGQQALGQYQQELGVLSQNIVPEKEGLAIGEAFAAGKLKDPQGAVDAAIAKYNANPRAQMQVLQTAAMPEGEYDPARLLDARQKRVDTLHGDAKQLDQNAFTLARDELANKRAIALEGLRYKNTRSLKNDDKQANNALLAAISGVESTVPRSQITGDKSAVNTLGNTIGSALQIVEAKTNNLEALISNAKTPQEKMSLTKARDLLILERKELEAKAVREFGDAEKYDATLVPNPEASARLTKIFSESDATPEMKLRVSEIMTRANAERANTPMAKYEAEFQKTYGVPSTSEKGMKIKEQLIKENSSDAKYRDVGVSGLEYLQKQVATLSEGDSPEESARKTAEMYPAILKKAKELYPGMSETVAVKRYTTENLMPKYAKERGLWFNPSIIDRDIETVVENEIGGNY